MIRFFAVFLLLAIASIENASGSPIDIKSDFLTIKQKENVAIFKKNVKVFQDSFSMESAEMYVLYHNKEDNSDNNLSKIISKGNVLLTLPRKKAEADMGKYDVDQKRIVLIGNVKLNQGGNTLNGDKLVYDVTTGKSRMFRRPSKNKSGIIKRGRVKGTFQRKNIRPEHKLRTQKIIVPIKKRFIPIPVKKPSI